MAKKTQRRKMAAPTPELSDFTAVLQDNLADLFDSVHTHNVVSAAPGTADGSIGDIHILDDGTTTKLYVKTRRGWKSVTLS